MPPTRDRHPHRDPDPRADHRDDPHEPTRLEQHWTTHVSIDTGLFDRLVIRHRERQRRYHRIEHVEAVIEHVVHLADHEPVADLAAVVAAAFYHDAVYEPTHPANERASARLARGDLTTLGWNQARIDAVSTMIEGTKTHLDPGGVDTAVLFDADLAILGADADDYHAYGSAVREEYGYVDASEWRAGRATVLQGFLEREVIYATPTARKRWEQTARTNITSELAALQD